MKKTKKKKKKTYYQNKIEMLIFVRTWYVYWTERDALCARHTIYTSASLVANRER